MKAKSSALERARADLAAGRPDRARDRLHGYLFTLHKRAEYSQETYLLLGDVFFAMRDFPRAGAAWLLTERDDADAQFAFEAFKQRFGTNVKQGLASLRPHAPSELYPPKVQERLREWNYRFLPYRSRTHASPEEETSDTPGPTVRPIEAGCIAAVILGFVLFCLYVYMAFFGRQR